MTRTSLKTLLALAFVGVGRAAARATQRPVTPDFEMSVATTNPCGCDPITAFYCRWV